LEIEEAVAVIGSLVSTWASYYANHGMVRTLVEFGHLAPLIAGAGLAVTSDTEVLRLSEQHYERRHSVLDRLRASHDIVLVSLVFIVISGGLMFAADVDTYLRSTYFWIKMGLVVILLANGAFLRYADSRVMYNPDDETHWHRVRRAAALSFLLWFVTTFIGVALPNVA
jgi:hypothetical protein